MANNTKQQRIQLKKNRIRSRFSGTAKRPRLSVNVSLRQVSAQLIDDVSNTSIAGISSAKEKTLVSKSLTEKATWVGTEIAKLAKQNKVSQVVFDRGHRSFHGRVKALADAAHKEGLEF